MKKNKIKKNKINFSEGISTVAIVIALAVVLLVIAVIIFTSIYTGRDRTPEESADESEQITEPVYEATIENIRFIFSSAKDHGDVLKGSLSRSSVFNKEDLLTTERFIEVAVKAQNKGQFDTKRNDWSVGNIIDSEGRNFIPLGFQAILWLPRPDLCGEVLKPEFEPTPCVKIYEVSKAAEGLKIEVFRKDKRAILDLLLSK